MHQSLKRTSLHRHDSSLIVPSANCCLAASYPVLNKLANITGIRILPSRSNDVAQVVEPDIIDLSAFIIAANVWLAVGWVQR